jgi:GH43 family beta-xylosidase
MKKNYLSLILCFYAILGGCCESNFQKERSHSSKNIKADRSKLFGMSFPAYHRYTEDGIDYKKSCDIQIRDPFIVPVEEEKLYYLYGTTDKNCWDGPAIGFDCYKSRNLENWEGPIVVFRRPEGFWADKNFWAPEVHRYQGRYFMFASFKADGVCRGTQILVSDSPCGHFVPHSPEPITPRDWECLDGTFYIEDERPWMVFCHEWTQVRDGQICAIELSKDLKKAVGKPVLLFCASEAPWAVEYKNGNYVTDGPFLYRAQNGELCMLWSSIGRDGYAMGIARSKTGLLAGPWEQDVEPLYGKDGGHGMFFRKFSGELILTLHRPNKTPNERPVFLPVRR